MGNMIITVDAKSYYNWLHTDEALGFLKSDNNKNKSKTSKNNVHSVWGALPGLKIRQRVKLYFGSYILLNGESFNTVG